MGKKKDKRFGKKPWNYKGREKWLYRKHLHLLNGVEKGFQYMVYVNVNRKGEIFESNPEFSLVEIDNFERCLFNRVIKTMGMCLICGEIDFTVLEEHHPDKEKMPDFKITLCGNCHNRLHFYYGK